MAALVCILQSLCTIPRLGPVPQKLTVSPLGPPWGPMAEMHLASQWHPMQGARVWSLVQELDPACCN